MAADNDPGQGGTRFRQDIARINNLSLTSVADRTNKPKSRLQVVPERTKGVDVSESAMGDLLDSLRRLTGFVPPEEEG